MLAETMLIITSESWQFVAIVDQAVDRRVGTMGAVCRALPPLKSQICSTDILLNHMGLQVPPSNLLFCHGFYLSVNVLNFALRLRLLCIPT